MIDVELCQPGAYFSDLRRRMRERGVTMYQLARACEPPVARCQMSRWMRRGNPYLVSVGRLETALRKLGG
jgi:hypothetical protein